METINNNTFKEIVDSKIIGHDIEDLKNFSLFSLFSSVFNKKEDVVSFFNLFSFDKETKKRYFYKERKRKDFLSKKHPSLVKFNNLIRNSYFTNTMKGWWGDSRSWEKKRTFFYQYSLLLENIFDWYEEISFFTRIQDITSNKNSPERKKIFASSSLFIYSFSKKNEENLANYFLLDFFDSEKKIKGIRRLDLIIDYENKILEAYIHLLNSLFEIEKFKKIFYCKITSNIFLKIDKIEDDIKKIIEEIEKRMKIIHDFFNHVFFNENIREDFFEYTEKFITYYNKQNSNDLELKKYFDNVFLIHYEKIKEYFKIISNDYISLLVSLEQSKNNEKYYKNDIFRDILDYNRYINYVNEEISILNTFLEKYIEFSFILEKKANSKFVNFELNEILISKENFSSILEKKFLIIRKDNNKILNDYLEKIIIDLEKYDCIIKSENPKPFLEILNIISEIKVKNNSIDLNFDEEKYNSKTVTLNLFKLFDYCQKSDKEIDYNYLKVNRENAEKEVILSYFDHDFANKMIKEYNKLDLQIKKASLKLSDFEERSSNLKKEILLLEEEKKNKHEKEKNLNKISYSTLHELIFLHLNDLFERRELDENGKREIINSIKKNVLKYYKYRDKDESFFFDENKNIELTDDEIIEKYICFSLSGFVIDIKKDFFNYLSEYLNEKNKIINEIMKESEDLKKKLNLKDDESEDLKKKLNLKDDEIKKIKESNIFDTYFKEYSAFFNFKNVCSFFLGIIFLYLFYIYFFSGNDDEEDIKVERKFKKRRNRKS